MAKKIAYKNKQSGFTLIEVVIYLALFSMIMSGAIVSVYSIIESSGRNQTKAMVQEEGGFLLGKIDWTLTDVKINYPSGIAEINSPTLDSTENTLSLIKYEAGMPVNIIINISNDKMTLERSGNLYPLNNDNVSVKCPPLPKNCFIRLNDEIESIEANFILSTKTPEGLNYEQKFSTIKYLRK